MLRNREEKAPTVWLSRCGQALDFIRPIIHKKFHTMDAMQRERVPNLRGELHHVRMGRGRGDRFCMDIEGIDPKTRIIYVTESKDIAMIHRAGNEQEVFRAHEKKTKKSGWARQGCDSWGNGAPQGSGRGERGLPREASPERTIAAWEARS